jgi:Protein of unknown function (DUF1570)
MMCSIPHSGRVREQKLAVFSRCSPIAVALLLTLAIGTLRAAEEPPLPRMPFEETTAHYHVQSDVSAAFTKTVALHMEALYEEYSRRLKGYDKLRETGQPSASEKFSRGLKEDGVNKDRFDIRVFKTEANYNNTLSMRKGSVGVHNPMKQLLAAHAERNTDEEVLRTLYHEGFHQFMFNTISPFCPVWLNEGLAEYFGDATWNGKRFVTGERPPHRIVQLRAIIKAGRAIPLKDLFSMKHEEWQDNVFDGKTKKVTVQYLQAWSVVHFLVHANQSRYAKHLEGVLIAIHKGKPGTKAFLDVFGKNLPKFESEWKRYVLAMTPTPKYDARDRMGAILWLAPFVYKDFGRLTSVLHLKKTCTVGGRTWATTTPAGVRIRHGDKKAFNRLFRCPLAPAGKSKKGFMVAQDPRSKLPMLVCIHHPGVILLARYVPNGKGSHRPQMEDIARGTVPKDIRAAIIAAAKK